MNAPFKSLALGARFRLLRDDTRVFVKIGYNQIAAWDDAQVIASWRSQGVFFFDSEGDVYKIVEVIL